MTLEEQFAAVNNHYSLAEFFNIGEIVRGQDDGCAAFLIDLLDKLADAFFGNYIQADGGFIQEENLRVMQQCGTNIGAHTLAQRKGAHRRIEKGVEFERCAEFV